MQEYTHTISYAPGTATTPHIASTQKSVISDSTLSEIDEPVTSITHGRLSGNDAIYDDARLATFDHSLQLDIQFIPISFIASHEHTEVGKPELLAEDIKKENKFSEAIVVAHVKDKHGEDKYVVLDGHHRFEVCKNYLATNFVPAFVLPESIYRQDTYIKVKRWCMDDGTQETFAKTLRNRNLEVSKDTVIEVGLDPQDNFEKKSTQHMVNFSLPKIDLNLTLLKELDIATPTLFARVTAKLNAQKKFVAFWLAQQEVDRQVVCVGSEPLKVQGLNVS